MNCEMSLAGWIVAIGAIIGMWEFFRRKLLPSLVTSFQPQISWVKALYKSRLGKKG